MPNETARAPFCRCIVCGAPPSMPCKPGCKATPITIDAPPELADAPPVPSTPTSDPPTIPYSLLCWLSATVDDLGGAIDNDQATAIVSTIVARCQAALAGNPEPATDAPLTIEGAPLELAAELTRWRRELDDWQAIAIDELETDSASFKDDPPRSPAVLVEACRRLAVLFVLRHEASSRQLRKPAPGVPERCPSCLSTESTAVRVIESRIGGYGALVHDDLRGLGSGARACTSCGAIYFPLVKG